MPKLALFLSKAMACMRDISLALNMTKDFGIMAELKLWQSWHCAP